MSVRVTREMFPWLPRYWASCDRCDAEISWKSASYCCKDCGYYLCESCATTLLRSQRRSAADAGQHIFAAALFGGLQVRETYKMLRAGDIFFCGPDMWGIHHVVLCCSPMCPAEPDVIGSVYQNSPQVTGLSIFECQTMESSRPLHGQDFPWYPARSFFALQPFTEDDGCESLSLLLVADIADGTHCVGVNVQPVPVKMLLHPLRPGHGGPPLIDHVFKKALAEGGKESKCWSKTTALRAVLTTFGGQRHSLDPEKYDGPESRAELMAMLTESWKARPICPSVAIMVWQRYLVMVSGNGPDRLDTAAKHVLRWMPLRCDRTSPSAMLKVLSTCGWSLRTTFEA